MTKTDESIIELPVAPLATVDVNNLPVVADDWDDDYMEKLAKADDVRATAKQWSIDNTIDFQSGNNNRINHSVFHYSQKALLKTEAADERHFDHMFRVTLTEAREDGTMRVKVLGYVGYTGDAVTQITGSGKIPVSQDLDLLARVHHSCKKARKLSEVYNEFYFKRHDVSKQAVRVIQPPVSTGDSMDYK